MGTEHNHAIPKTTHEGSLFAALILTSIFLVAEIIGGYVTGSLALISDAAHMLGSVGVILGAIIIRFTSWEWIDSVIAVAIGLWVLPRTWVLLKESLNILLEGIPAGVDLQQIKKAMCETSGVIDVHELHIWAITSGKISLTAHVVIDQSHDCDKILSTLRQMLASKFEISHVTLQHESKICLNESVTCHFSQK